MFHILLAFFFTILFILLIVCFLFDSFLDSFGINIIDIMNWLTIYLFTLHKGNPRPLLYWYKNNQLLDDQWTITAQGIVRNELFLSYLQRTDQGSLLTCQSLINVSDDSISKVISNSILVSDSTLSSSSNVKTNYKYAGQIRSALLANTKLIEHISTQSNSTKIIKLEKSQSSIFLELNGK